jgi:hypothetical protein
MSDYSLILFLTATLLVDAEMEIELFCLKTSSLKLLLFRNS